MMRIPKKKNHPVIGDNLTRFYHYPVIKYFFLQRLEMALGFMGKDQIGSVLEIGFGSGVFFPELSKRASKVFGLDLHEHIPMVKQMLNNEEINAGLIKGNLLNLPYNDETFDCVICVGTLEHIHKLKEAIGEIKRVLKKDGKAIFGFPVQNRLSDILLIVTGSLKAYKQKLKEIHPNSHSDILNEAKGQFGDVKVRNFPSLIPLDFSLYCGCVCKK